jgi:hypothetical protein
MTRWRRTPDHVFASREPVIQRADGFGEMITTDQ